MRILITILLLLLTCVTTKAQFDLNQITWCGERVPIEIPKVRKKLLRILKKNYFTSGINDKKTQQRMFLYLPYLEATLKKYGLPDDLKFVPMVESRFNRFEVSSAGAVGIWQIMPEVGTDDNMFVNATNTGIDDRNSVIKSTNTACRWWLTFHRMVKTWTLTAASYNWGPGNIIRRIRETGKDNYWTMPLNEETSDYVYELVSFKILYKFLIEKKLKDFYSDQNKLLTSLMKIKSDDKLLTSLPSTKKETIDRGGVDESVQNKNQDLTWHSGGFNGGLTLTKTRSKEKSITDNKKIVTAPNKIIDTLDDFDAKSTDSLMYIHTDSVYVAAEFLNSARITNKGAVTFRLLAPVVVNDITLGKNTLINGLIYGSNENRVLVTISGIDISPDLAEYDIQLSDLAGQLGIPATLNSRKDIIINDGYKVKLKFIK